MKYMIEFDLPDNDTVLREIKTENVAWGIWGYRGYTKAKPVQRWIPCKTALPKSDMDVLVTDGEDCAVAYWRTDAQAWDDSMHGWCDLYGLDVIAWQPLPKPWEGEQDENN